MCHPTQNLLTIGHRLCLSCLRLCVRVSAILLSARVGGLSRLALLRLECCKRKEDVTVLRKPDLGKTGNVLFLLRLKYRRPQTVVTSNPESFLKVREKSRVYAFVCNAVNRGPYFGCRFFCFLEVGKNYKYNCVYIPSSVGRAADKDRPSLLRMPILCP